MYLGDQGDAVLCSLFIFTATSFHMFRVSPAPIIGNTQAVITTTGTSQMFEECNDKIRLKRVHGRAATSLLHGLWPRQSEVAARPWTLFKRILSLHSSNF